MSETTQEELGTLEIKLNALGTPADTLEFKQYLESAGFTIETEAFPAWNETVALEGLAYLSVPQLEKVYDTGSRMLAKRIANDVEKGMSVEDAYMKRAATDPAATLIAEAKVAWNKKIGLQAEMEALKEKATIKLDAENQSDKLKSDFILEIKAQSMTPNEKRGLEQIYSGLQKGMLKEPEKAKHIREDATDKLKQGKFDWKNPEHAIDDVLNQARTTEALTRKNEVDLQALSSQEFTRVAAKEYVERFDQAIKKNQTPENAAVFAVSHVKELAKRAKLKVAFKDISNDKLLNASKSAKSVEEVFSGHIKPTRIAAMKKNRSHEKGNER